MEQYKENLKLISLITPKISNLEIYLRNALDYCLTQIKGNDWVFNEDSLTNLINELKEKKKEITYSLILSKMSLGAVIRLIFCYKLEGVILDLRTYSLKAYYKDNKDTLLIKGRKQHLSNYAKAYIALFAKLQSINLGRIKMSFAPMLLATINNSIGNKDKHVSLEYLIGLFMDKKTTNLSNTDKYIIGTIQTEALEQEIEWFSQDYHIPMENILHVLSINPYQ
ncbi:hypothetical protein SNTW_04680 [Helicobacter suis]|nr:hypothetical protein SNTW_04680 [Helicobacter suis]